MVKDTKKKSNPLLDEENELETSNDVKKEDAELVTKATSKAKGSSSIEAEIKGDHKIVKDALAKEAKIRILIPLNGSEKKGVTIETVTIDGFKIEVPKGVYVDVPQSVADLIERHYNTTPENTEVGEAFRLDKNRVKDGSSTDDALL
jgi:hypothetical protein